MKKLTVMCLFILMFSSCRPPQTETDYGEMAPEIVVDPVQEVPEEEVEDPIVIEDPVDDDDVVEQVKSICERAQEESRVLRKSEQLFFPRTRDCEFNDNTASNNVWEINAAGNGPRQNNRVRAYLRQDSGVILPDNSVICDIDFDFPTQDMKYDDEIFLLLNDYVLLMSTNYSTNSSYSQYAQEGLKVNDQGLVEFKWMDRENSVNDLYNLDYGQNKAPRYCQGIPSTDENYGERCAVPRTETTGSIKLDIPKEDIIKMGALKLDQSTDRGDLNFSFVTTGDNDSGDCEHADYYFNVEIHYVSL